MKRRSGNGYRNGIKALILACVGLSLSGLLVGFNLLMGGLLMGGADEYQVPTAPQGVMASEGTEEGKVVVSWQDATGATSYLVYRALAEDAVPVVVATVAETTYEDMAVEADVVYWYWVRACNDMGCSPLSSPDSCSPGAGEEPPPPL